VEVDRVRPRRGKQVIAKIVDQQLRADDEDEQACGGFESGEASEQLVEQNGCVTDEDHTHHPAGDNDLQFGVSRDGKVIDDRRRADERDGGGDTVDRESDSGKLDDDGGGPEAGHGNQRGGRSFAGEGCGLGVFLLPPVVPKVLDSDPEQVPSPEQLDDMPLK